MLEPIKETDEEKRISLFEEKDYSAGEDKKSPGLSCLNIFKALKNPVFIFSSLIRVTLMGVNTAFQYWINDYIRNGLGEKDTNIVFMFYTFINIVGPIGGIFANALMMKLFGSYENKNSSYGVLVFHMITCAFGMMIPFAWNLITFGGATIMYLFFNSAVLPMVQGIIINSVSNEIRGNAFAFVNLFTMIVTSGPLPLIYGVVNDAYQDTAKNMGMIVIMSLENIAIIFICFMIYFRKKSKEGPFIKENISEGVELRSQDDESNKSSKSSKSSN